MIDYLRSLTRSAEEKRREQLNAYVDGALSERERRRFEQELAGDPRLQAELTQIEEVRSALRRLPRLRSPRNFTLDPATYGVPKPYRAAQWYPVLRTATAIAALAFAFLLALNLFVSQSGRLIVSPTVSNDSARELPVEAERAVPESIPAADEALAEEVVAESDPAESAAQIAPPLEMESAEEAAAEESVEEEAPAAEATQPPSEAAPAEPAAPESAAGAAAEDALESQAYPPPPIAFTPRAYPMTPALTEEAVAELPAPELAAEPTATPDSTARATKSSAYSALLLAQIAVGLTFVGLLIAWLAVRRRL